MSFAVFSILIERVSVFALDLTDFVQIPANLKNNEFYIGKYPVTNAQYKIFTDSTKIKMPKYWKNGIYPTEKENHPVVFISYNNALSYCKWLEQKYPEYTFRLPTVEEWEYAASGEKKLYVPMGKSSR